MLFQSLRSTSIVSSKQNNRIREATNFVDSQLEEYNKVEEYNINIENDFEVFFDNVEWMSIAVQSENDLIKTEKKKKKS